MSSGLPAIPARRNSQQQPVCSGVFHPISEPAEFVISGFEESVRDEADNGEREYDPNGDVAYFMGRLLRDNDRVHRGRTRRCSKAKPGWSAAPVQRIVMWLFLP